MTREPTLDRPDLELAWSDMEAQSDLYRPSVFWRGASEVLLAEVRAHGVEGFRASKTALGFFVHAGFLAIPAFMGAGLVFAGSTGFCGMAVAIGKLPWNRAPVAACRA